eukprot:5833020-Prymnesium_polylepis.1
MARAETERAVRREGSRAERPGGAGRARRGQGHARDAQKSNPVLPTSVRTSHGQTNVSSPTTRAPQIQTSPLTTPFSHDPKSPRTSNMVGPCASLNLQSHSLCPLRGASRPPLCDSA